MSRANTTFGLLQASAVIVGLAIVMWSMGFVSLPFAQAANVTNLSVTLSDSAPAASADHTITFVTPTGVAEGETIVIDFSDGPFATGTVDHTDVEFFNGATNISPASSCVGSDPASAVFSPGPVLTITLCSGNGESVPANGTTTILIGENATGGDAQLTNPALGTYDILVTAGSEDTGKTIVAIVDPVTVKASVDTTFSFEVEGVGGGAGSGVTVNGEDVTGTTTPSEINFGTLVGGTATTAAQQLIVSTNASYGFVVTVQVDQQLTSATGADINSFIEGADTSTPTAWAPPNPVITDNTTWGHWGLTTDDATLSGDPFDAGGSGQLFVAASTSPVAVFQHDGPTNGTGQNIGTARVGYKIEITNLQEAADDYRATLTYVATPIF